jgi:hypothetical protein
MGSLGETGKAYTAHRAPELERKEAGGDATRLREQTLRRALYVELGSLPKRTGPACAPAQILLPCKEKGSKNRAKNFEMQLDNDGGWSYLASCHCT